MKLLSIFLLLGAIGLQADESEQVDRLVEENLLRVKQSALPPSTDSEFLRRIYLDITGRIPDYQEAVAFLEDGAPNKRGRLIDELLDSPGYVSHTFNWWADILRIQSGGTPSINVSGVAYQHWVMDSIAANAPYDTMVTELLNPSSPDGMPVFAWDNGAAGYYMRDAGMPLDNMSNTMQIFMGTRLVCAQCHDHPFDKWSQMDYHQMAAFTYNTIDTRVRGRAVIPELFKGKENNQYTNQALNNLLNPIQYGVVQTKRSHKLPHDYRSKRSPADPGKVITPSTAGFKDSPRSKKGKGKTLLNNYAEWMTSPENRRFNQVIANRLWKRAFGYGLVEPVDDWKDETEPSNRYLMDHLSRLIVRKKYDTKDFMRVLYNTRTYQRRCYGDDIPAGSNFHFVGPVLRRMTAEQIYDSVGNLNDVINESFRQKPPKAFNDGMRASTMIFAIEPKARVKLVESIGERLAQHAKDVAKTREEGGPGMRKKLAQFNKRRDVDIAKFKDDAFKPMPPPPATDNKDENQGFHRASSMRQPAPNGHFLRQFGQSNREVIQNASASPSVDQALSLLNDPSITKTPRLLRAIEGVEDEHEIQNILFISVLTRYPTDRERKIMSAAKPADIAWALLNTSEFLFLQ